MEFNKCYNLNCEEGLKLIRTESIDLVLTDPPYDVDFGGKQKALLTIRSFADGKKMDVYRNYIEYNCDYGYLARQFYRVLKDDIHCYLFAGHQQIDDWVVAMTKTGFKFVQLLNWERNKVRYDLTMGHKYLENKEQILFFQKGWKKLNLKSIKSSFKFDSAKTDGNEWHSCPRPYELLKMLMLNSSNESDVVLDCFAGSGEHLVTAMKLRRNFIGFELSKEFHKRIEQRIEFQKQQFNLIQYI